MSEREIPVKKNSNLVILFAKAPVPGTVKTRMIPALSPATAAELHSQLVDGTLRRLLPNDCNTYELELHSNDAQHPWIQSRAKNYSVPVILQTGDGLGERMSAAFAQAFVHYERVVICGGDSLEFSEQQAKQLFAALDQHDAALVPTHDGGYIAIAAKSSVVADCLLEGIHWGSDQVFAQTLTNASRHQLSISASLKVADIDTPEDLRGTEFESNLNKQRAEAKRQ